MAMLMGSSEAEAEDEDEVSGERRRMETRRGRGRVGERARWWRADWQDESIEAREADQRSRKEAMHHWLESMATNSAVIFVSASSTVLTSFPVASQCKHFSKLPLWIASAMPCT